MDRDAGIPLGRRKRRRRWRTGPQRARADSARQRRPLERLAAVALALLALAASATAASAHAEPERANPSIGGVVPATPAVVEIWFDTAVTTDGTTILVVGPGGIQVDLGDATVDQSDPERNHVTVSLRPDSGPGSYAVQWRAVSAEDGDSTQGEFRFGVGAGSPTASVASPIPPTTESAAASTGAASATDEPASDSGDFDSTAFGLSVGAGIVAALFIYGIWRLVRPKNPTFKG